MINSNNIAETGPIFFWDDSYHCEWGDNNNVLCFLDDDDTFSTVFITNWVKTHYDNVYVPPTANFYVGVLNWHD